MKLLVKMDVEWVALWTFSAMPLDDIFRSLFFFFYFESHILIFTIQAFTPHVHQNIVTPDSKWISLLNCCEPLLRPTLTHTGTHSREPGGGELARADSLMCRHIISLPQCLVAHLLSSTDNRSVPVPSRGNASPHVSALMRLFIVTQLSYLHPPTLHLSPYQTHQICCLSASPVVIRQKSRAPQTK